MFLQAGARCLAERWRSINSCRLEEHAVKTHKLPWVVRSGTRALSGACLALFAVAAPAQSQVAWSAAGDFTFNANPNGAWSYLARKPGGDLTLMTIVTQPCWGQGFRCWTTDDGQTPTPFIGINTTGMPFRAYTIVFAESMLIMHPDNNGLRPVVAWTAPADGRYRVTGQFQSVDVTPQGVEVRVRSGHKLLLDEILSSFGEAAQFDLTLNLLAGENVQFSVAKHGDYFYDSTGLKVAVLPLE